MKQTEVRKTEHLSILTMNHFTVVVGRVVNISTGEKIHSNADD